MQNEIMPADQKPRQGVRGYIMGKNLTVFRQAICGYFLFLAAQKGYALCPYIPDGKGRICERCIRMTSRASSMLSILDEVGVNSSGSRKVQAAVQSALHRKAAAGAGIELERNPDFRPLVEKEFSAIYQIRCMYLPSWT